MNNYNRTLLLITPTAPPETCGASDYSYRLARELQSYYKIVRIGVQRLPQVTENIQHEVSVQLWKEAINKIKTSENGSDLILNFTPFSYAASAYPRKLIKAIKDFRSAQANNRFFLLVHEAWSGSPALQPHQKIRDQLVKWSLLQLAKQADGIATLTEDQRKKIEAASSRKNIFLCPVGSSILPVHTSDGLSSQRKKGEWIVFGLAHTRLWALQALLPYLKELYTKGAFTKIYAIGPNANEYAAAELSLAEKSFGEGVLIQTGRLPVEDTSNLMLQSEAALVGQSADSLGKSSTFVALAVHALPVICELKEKSTNPPSESVFNPAELLRQPDLFSTEQGKHRIKQLYDWYQNTRSWEVIGERVYGWLAHNTAEDVIQLPVMSR